jgi:hypothetical protein
VTVFNSNSLRDNAPKLVPGSRWRTRARPHKYVELISVEPGVVTICGQHRQRKKPKTRTVSRYGFLQVFLPVEGKDAAS